MAIDTPIIPTVPKLLSPEEFAAKQDAERAEQETLRASQAVPFSHTEMDQVETPQSFEEVVQETAAGILAIALEPPAEVPAELLGLDAAGLVSAADGVGELVQAMLLTAWQQADLALDGGVRSIGLEIARLRVAMESIRTMLEDTDTADTLGPVVVTVLDYMTDEVSAWVTGSRKASGTEHTLPDA